MPLQPRAICRVILALHTDKQDLPMLLIRQGAMRSARCSKRTSSERPQLENIMVGMDMSRAESIDSCLRRNCASCTNWSMEKVSSPVPA